MPASLCRLRSLRAHRMVLVALTCLTALLLSGSGAPAHAFCGFFVSGADAQLYNNASQVVQTSSPGCPDENSHHREARRHPEKNVQVVRQVAWHRQTPDIV